MANHGHVRVRGRLCNADQIDKDLRRIIERRFQDHLVVDRDETGDGSYWVVTIKGSETHGWSCWVETRRTLEFRHPRGDFLNYTQTVVQHELAALYNGWITDEGVEGKWDPDVNKFRKFTDWLDMFGPQMRELGLKYTPEELREL